MKDFVYAIMRIHMISDLMVYLVRDGKETKTKIKKNIQINT